MEQGSKAGEQEQNGRESEKAKKIAAEPRRATMTPTEWAKNRPKPPRPISREAIRQAMLDED